MTRSIDLARHLAEKKIGLSGEVFAQLLQSLANPTGHPFDLTQLYELNHADFTLALEVISDWRLHCYSYFEGAREPAETIAAAPASH